MAQLLYGYGEHICPPPLKDGTFRVPVMKKSVQILFWCPFDHIKVLKIPFWHKKSHFCVILRSQIS